MAASDDPRPPPLRLVYADELGQLKVVQSADGAQPGTAVLIDTWGTPDKAQAIDCMALDSASGLGDTGGAVLAVARCSGGVELRSPLSGALLGSIPPAAAPAGSKGKQAEEAVRVRGLHLLWGDDAADGLPAVLTVTQGGTARVHSPVAQQQAAAPPAEQQQQQRSAAWEERRSWQVPPEVCCTAYDAASGRLAVGCQGAELRLFQASSGELVFGFKGGKPNMVGLVDRPWNTALAFLPPPSGGGGAPGSRVLVGTGHHKVRLYDAEAGKRPQMEMSWREGRITALAVEPDGQRCWVANGQGHIEVLDLASRKFCGAIKGLAGSARALAAHPGAPLLASVGLDRYLRLHDRGSRQLVAKVYLKTLPSGVAFCPTDASMLPPRKEPSEEDKEAAKRQRRRRKAAASSDDNDDGDDSEQDNEAEAEAAEAAARRQAAKRSKARGDGGRRRQKQRRAADDSD